jgi:biotin carboxyl carrier protein
MSLLPPSSGSLGRGLTDEELARIVDAFQRSGRSELELRVGDTWLCLGLPASKTDTNFETKTTVTAPFVGVFTSSVRIGQTVRVGTGLGEIRSVQAETEVHAPHDGKIASQLVLDGRFVAFGEPLFEIVALAPGRG